MLADRMFRAAMLDPLVFDEIKEDSTAMFQSRAGHCHRCRNRRY